MSLEGAAVSLGSGVVSLAFTAMVMRNFWERRKPHNLLWGIGLLMFTLVTFVQVAAELGTWTDGLFRAWYLLGTSLVAFLGGGSVYIAHRRLGHAFAAYVAVLFLAFLAVVLTTPTNPVEIATFGTVGPSGAVVMPSGEGWAVRTPRLMSPLFTIPGTATLLGIAVVGLWRHRLTYNAWIAAGAIVLAVGTGLATLGNPSLIYGAEFAGIVLLFTGFWKAVAWAKEQREKSPGGGPPPARADAESPPVAETAAKRPPTA